MKSAHQWFEAYAESHQNPTNKLIHWICVPLIFFSILGLLASFSMGLFGLIPADSEYFAYLHLGTLGLLVSLGFYLRLSPKLSIGLLVFAAFCLYGIKWMYLSEKPLWSSSLTIFVAAWVGQFYGHKVEGKKPSFFQDVQFLLIGPAWLMHFIYKRLGISID
jgi:uncharacterized membrane protein YGL010W